MGEWERETDTAFVNMKERERERERENVLGGVKERQRDSECVWESERIKPTLHWWASVQLLRSWEVFFLERAVFVSILPADTPTDRLTDWRGSIRKTLLNEEASHRIRRKIFVCDVVVDWNDSKYLSSQSLLERLKHSFVHCQSQSWFEFAITTKSPTTPAALFKIVKVWQNDEISTEKRGIAFSQNRHHLWGEEKIPFLPPIIWISSSPWSESRSPFRYLRPLTLVRWVSGLFCAP